MPKEPFNDHIFESTSTIQWQASLHNEPHSIVCEALLERTHSYANASSAASSASCAASVLAFLGTKSEA
eukprot:2367804-Amphidinium_carterae.1